ncbi:hypothetical protein GWI33_021558 [Rhynchophorus ferrugineus]|uniref:Uncharacterized protein n=1 Tax=Rhynchophorus ferrugineus TaxID=354439 RepID=A0A834IVT5_RHYFE|nr:hypothetical protein GWI33_021558 [Rhynchophorus ferrugineus]
MQTSTIIFKTDTKEFRIPSGAIVSSSTSSPTTSMRPPPPPPPPKVKLLDNKLEEPTSSIPDLANSETKTKQPPTNSVFKCFNNCILLSSIIKM